MALVVFVVLAVVVLVWSSVSIGLGVVGDEEAGEENTLLLLLCLLLSTAAAGFPSHDVYTWRRFTTRNEKRKNQYCYVDSSVEIICI